MLAGFLMCAIRRHRRREAGRKGLYTFGMAPGAEDADGVAGDLDPEMSDSVGIELRAVRR